MNTPADDPERVLTVILVLLFASLATMILAMP